MFGQDSLAMVFYPPEWVPKLPYDPPDTIPICDFFLDEKYGRLPFEKSFDPYTCAISGKTYSPREQKQRTEQLARALAKEFGWRVNQGTEYDKVVGVFTLNTVRNTGHPFIPRLDCATLTDVRLIS